MMQTTGNDLLDIHPPNADKRLSDSDRQKFERLLFQGFGFSLTPKMLKLVTTLNGLPPSSLPLSAVCPMKGQEKNIHILITRESLKGKNKYTLYLANRVGSTLLSSV